MCEMTQKNKYRYNESVNDGMERTKGLGSSFIYSRIEYNREERSGVERIGMEILDSIELDSNDSFIQSDSSVLRSNKSDDTR